MYWLENRGISYSEYYSPKEMYEYIKSILDPHNIVNFAAIDYDHWYKKTSRKELVYQSIIIDQIENKLDAFKVLLTQKFKSVHPDYNYSFKGYNKMISTFYNAKNYRRKYIELEKTKFRFFCKYILSVTSDRHLLYIINSDFYKIPRSMIRTLIYSGVKIAANARVISMRFCYTSQNSKLGLMKEFRIGYNEFLKRKKFFTMIEESYFKRNPYFDLLM